MLFPMIYLDPSYPSCIYNKLKFLSYQAKQYDATSILTFDQPLYWKALICIQSQTVGRDLKRYMLTGNAISIADRRHMLIDAALNTIRVAKVYHIPLTTKETDEPKWDTASTDPETGNEEIRSAGQQQVTVQTTTTRKAILWLQYLNKVTILHRFISKLNGLATVNNTFKQCTTCCQISRIWAHTTCTFCIRIWANDSSSSRNSSRRLAELHGKMPCVEMHRHVFGQDCPHT